jgi:hypothetical protein
MEIKYARFVRLNRQVVSNTVEGKLQETKINYEHRDAISVHNLIDNEL